MGALLFAVPSSPECRLIGQTLGTCEIVEKLGQGGMGEVRRVKDTRLGREAALKSHSASGHRIHSLA